jgi:hypothetical protein
MKTGRKRYRVRANAPPAEQTPTLIFPHYSPLISKSIRSNPAYSELKNKNPQPPRASRFSASAVICVHLPRRSMTKAGLRLKFALIRAIRVNPPFPPACPPEPWRRRMKSSLPLPKLKITKRTHLSFPNSPPNKANLHVFIVMRKKNEPIFNPFHLCFVGAFNCGPWTLDNWQVLTYSTLFGGLRPPPLSFGLRLALAPTAAQRQDYQLNVNSVRYQ